ncbi:MAG: hypothetical protein FLDDKLPJ_03631 [Phycisphaerae bacterium]|nr:hypothetical protein [Phycisphaerae bacterium]
MKLLQNVRAYALGAFLILNGAICTSLMTKREYVHGPDYVDEFIAQVINPACDCAEGDSCGGGGEDGSGGGDSAHCGGTTDDDALPVYYLQDANYNVVATLDDGCPGGDCGSGGGGCGEPGAFCPEGPVGVYEQYTYEPYGQPSSVDKFITTPPQNTVGHQGLIFDRYCGNSIEDPCITTTQKGLYHNRNRYYHARLGRFATPDPNSSAIPLIEGLSYHGESLRELAFSASGALSACSPQGQFGDGMNLYGYEQSSPVGGVDPLGLFTYSDVLVGVSEAVGIGLRAYSAASLASGFVNDLQSGIGARNAFMNLAVNAAMDYAGGKAFDFALRGLNAVAGAGRLSRLERSKAWRESFEQAGGEIPPGWKLHHLFPQELEHLFATRCKPAINIHDPRWGMPLDPDWHTWLHSSKGFNWNGKWTSFFGKYRGDVPAQDAMDFLERLKKLAGEALKKKFGA